MNDPTLFDGAGRPTFDRAAAEREAEAKRLRDEGIRRSDTHAATSWKRHADEAIDYAARRLAELSADDVWIVLDGWGIPRPREARALGARMLSAVRRGSIDPTDRYRPSTRPELHQSPTRVYHSLLYLPLDDRVIS